MVEQNIPILANVGRSFDKQLPRLSAVFLSFQRHIVIVVHHLRFDKLGYEIGVDSSTCFLHRRAFLRVPSTSLIFTHRIERAET